jgi:hypothetical protein
MKRFIVSILCVSVFFIGLGGLVDRVGATFKSDEQALALIKQARAAIGGDANITNVRALTITAKATQNFTLDGATKSEQGDLEINLQLPNGYSKMLKIGNEGDAGGVKSERDVVIVRRDGDAQLLDKIESSDGKKKIFVMKKGEGEPMVFNSEGATADGKHKFVIKKGEENIEEVGTADDNKIIVNKVLHAAKGGMRHNELFRTAFALLLSAPEGSEVSYTYAGEGDVDGNSCNIIVAQTGGETFKLFLDKSTSLPRMMSFQAVKPLIIKFNKADVGASGEKEHRTFVRRAEGMEKLEKAEFQVRFSDYRSVGGLQMPYKWTQTVGGQVDQTVDIVNYEINPSNIAEKFQKSERKVMMRTPKPQ